MIIIPYYTDARQKSHGGVPSIYTHRKSDTLPAGNTSVRKVAERFQVSKSTVQELLKRKREIGKLLPRQAKGGKPSQLFGQEEQLKEMVVEHPDYTCFRIL